METLIVEIRLKNREGDEQLVAQEWCPVTEAQGRVVKSLGPGAARSLAVALAGDAALKEAHHD